MELSPEHEQELVNLKAHFPFRICFLALNAEGDKITGAVYTKHKPNKLNREGYNVWILQPK